MGVGTAVDEHDAATHEIGCIGQHEAHPLCQLAGVAEATDGYWEPLNRLGLLRYRQLLFE